MQNPRVATLVPTRHPILRSPAPTWDFTQSNADKALVDQVITRLQDQCLDLKGVGLAAPQLGLPYRIAVVGHAYNWLTLLDPVVHHEGSIHTEMVEGCLSLPGRRFTVTRWEHVKVTTLLWDGEGSPERMAIVASGFLARVLQHEVDHLEGQLIDMTGVEVK